MAGDPDFHLARGLEGHFAAFTEVPVIDLSGFRNGSDRAAVIDALVSACVEVGFFYVANHGVPSTLVEKTFAETKRFFAQPESIKQRLHIRHSPIHRGYFPAFEENTNPELTGDLKEGFDLARDLPVDHPDVLASKPLHGPNVWPDPELSPDFRPTMERYFAEMAGLGRLLLRCFALGLSLPEDWFEDKVDAPLAQLRLLHYPPQAGFIEERTLGCGAHSDYGCLTILAQDEVGGLQLQNAAGNWIEAPPIPHTFIVNIGDQMARWTNGRFAATRHRVINRSGRERYSLPFFFDPNYDTLVEALPSCLAPGEVPRYAPVLAGEYLQSRYDATFQYRKDAPDEGVPA